MAVSLPPLLEPLASWLAARGELLVWIGGASMLCCLASLWLVPFVINRMAVDTFTKLRALERGDVPPPSRNLLLAIAQNLLGIILLLAGIAMVFIPGQGLLTMFLGICLMNFPGKRKLILSLVDRPKIGAALNWIRERSGRKAFTLKG